MVLSNATCTVYVAGTSTAATLYSDNGITPLANPFLSSSTGQVAFYAANGTYDLVVSKIGYLTVTISAIELDDLLAPSGSNSVGYLPAGAGAVATTVQTKLRESVSVTDFGAVGDGVTDDTAAIQAAQTAIGMNGSLLVPHGSYLYSGTVYVVDADFVWHNQNFSGSASVNLMSQAQSKSVLFTSTTPNTTPINSADTRVPVGITVEAKGAQHADGVRSNLYNYSTDGDGNTAFYGYAASSAAGSGWSAALHGETFAGGGTNIGVNTESASFSASGSMYGAVLSNTTAVYIGTTHPITGASPIAATTAIATHIVGTALTNEMGGWTVGVNFNTDSMRTGSIGILFAQSKITTSLIRSYSGVSTSTADIFLEGSSAYGIILGGSYTNAALRINSGQYISLENTSKQKILSGTGTPESVVTASVGSLYCRLNGGANTTLYVKETGTGNTGWVAK